MSKLTPQERCGLAALIGIAGCGLAAFFTDFSVDPRERQEVQAAIALIGWSVSDVQSMHAVAHELLGDRHDH